MIFIVQCPYLDFLFVFEGDVIVFSGGSLTAPSARLLHFQEVDM